MRLRYNKLKFENYNEDQYDLLRELTNIAIGQATAELDHLWNTLVEFSIPPSHYGFF